MVTLDGAVINQSGTMSGGGNRVLKGRMSSTMVASVSPQQLSEMEQTLSRETTTHKVPYLTGLLPFKSVHVYRNVSMTKISWPS